MEYNCPSMLEFTKKADYALGLLTVLAGRGVEGKVTLNELGVLGYPKAFMAKIGKEMVEGGLLSVREGKNGGYSLNYPPEQITLRDALEVVEGEVEPVSCAGCGAYDECGQRDFMAELKGDLVGVMEKYTVKDLIS